MERGRDGGGKKESKKNYLAPTVIWQPQVYNLIYRDLK